MYKYTYFTKDEIEARLSKIEGCGRVETWLTEGRGDILVKYGDGATRSVSADKVAVKVSSNDNARAVVDCDEGMMVFPSEYDRDEYKARL